jgi:hypothetical protein
VEDLRSTTVADDPVQRRDLILMERARVGDLDGFNDGRLLPGPAVRPDRADGPGPPGSDVVQEAFFHAYRHLEDPAAAA